MDKIMATLREGLANAVGSQLVDPSQFVHSPRDAVEGAQHNDQLPSMFIYLLNHLSKAIINQFINECSANPRAADPIGVATAHIFSDPGFHWRGQSLIDVLIAKYRIVCPVLFGLRGSEKTEQGRQRLGWQRKRGTWATEQEHMDRMTGLGAGYAAISLRDFQRSKKENPWPPRKYWEAFAKIVNTPPQEISDTQCNVLKAMIDHYEQRFIGFYGTAGIAALRLALVDFPASAPAKTTPVTSLQVHAQLLKKDAGLRL
jgi:nucleoporin GLE1